MKKNSFIAVAALIIIVFSFFLLSASSFAGGSVEPLEIVAQPAIWHKGDIRTYAVERTGEIKDRKFKMTMTVIEATDKGYAVAVDYGGEKTIEYYNLKLNFVRATDEKGTLIEECDPEIALFKWPLKAGSWWTGEYYYRDNKGSLSVNNLVKTTTEAEPETLMVDNQEIAAMRLTFKKNSAKSKTTYGKREAWYDPISGYLLRRVDDRSLGKKEIRTFLSFTPGKAPQD